MSQNLQKLRIQEAKKANSKKHANQAKENISRESLNYRPKKTPKHSYKLNKYGQQNVLQNKDFNFELDQDFLQSRHLAYQSKDLYNSLRTAKEVEKSLMDIDQNERETCNTILFLRFLLFIESVQIFLIDKIYKLYKNIYIYYLSTSM